MEGCCVLNTGIEGVRRILRTLMLSYSNRLTVIRSNNEFGVQDSGVS
jgi:hypothetical protein